MIICPQTSQTFSEVTKRLTFTPSHSVAIKIPREISLKVGCDKHCRQILIGFVTEKFFWRVSSRKCKAFHKMHKIAIISLRKLLDWNNRLRILKIAFEVQLEKAALRSVSKTKALFMRWQRNLVNNWELEVKNVLIDCRALAISKSTAGDSWR